MPPSLSGWGRGRVDVRGAPGAHEIPFHPLNHPPSSWHNALMGTPRPRVLASGGIVATTGGPACPTSQHRKGKRMNRRCFHAAACLAVLPVSAALGQDGHGSIIGWGSQVVVAADALTDQVAVAGGEIGRASCRERV